MMMWLGAILSLGGIVWMGSRSHRHNQPLTRFSDDERETVATQAWIAANWPGLGVVVAGAAILLASNLL
jgi:hypothetical protein